jgi:uncharacterized membrane protein
MPDIIGAMLPFSYTLSEQLKTSLQKTDALRVQILIAPLSPKTELKYRWESMLDRTYYTLILDHSSVQKRTLVNLLTATPQIRKHKQTTAEEKQVLRFKQGLDFIEQEWLVSSKPVSIKTVINLHEVSSPGKYRKGESELKQLMEYLATNPDHPVIQAAVVYACIHRINPFTDGNGRMASLLMLMLLYKAGYDCRGFISLEKEWLNQPRIYQEKLNIGMNSAYMTGWIEYVAETLAANLEKKLQDIKVPYQTSEKAKTFFDLNNRQKAIMTIFNEPGTRVTNRDMQKRFKISQITASRDLAHLVLLGLLIPHGKGRSVYYIKLSTN